MIGYDNTGTTDRRSASSSKNSMDVKQQNIPVKPTWQSMYRYLMKYILHEIPMPYRVSHSDNVTAVFFRITHYKNAVFRKRNGSFSSLLNSCANNYTIL